MNNRTRKTRRIPHSISLHPFIVLKSEIISVKESNGDQWYQVPYLAQDTIFEDVPNLLENDPDFVAYRSSAPSLLKMRKTSKRYVTRLRSDNKLELQFGAGISDNNDEEIIPNPTNVGNGLSGLRRNIDIDIDPSNFLYTRTYGQAPSNTTLTVTYTIGNGISDNVVSNVLTNIQRINYDDDVNSTGAVPVFNFVKNTIAVTNPEPASGAKNADTLQDIKNNALSNFATQNRMVTRDDYIIRAYSMPSKFGSVAKAYIVPDDQIIQEDYVQNRLPNPLALNMYVLGFNENKQLTALNNAIKENLKTYLSQYRILTDAVAMSTPTSVTITLNEYGNSVLVTRALELFSLAMRKVAGVATVSAITAINQINNTAYTFTMGVNVAANPAEHRLYLNVAGGGTFPANLITTASIQYQQSKIS